ncbi:unnamed protein product [Parascedosporium putredinis]|uniref:Uncharacterized protein n=1 Tax=Parascedosporium putredinis TaxID=1442378 RepID=A0A9P1MCJ7_9PEZI|nr:unnamed protein product [Parascedosporium putredinis]CAI7997971.1 unnamed protein product [Parascedosporium putredinis]
MSGFCDSTPRILMMMDCLLHALGSIWGSIPWGSISWGSISEQLETVLAAWSYALSLSTLTHYGLALLDNMLVDW